MITDMFQRWDSEYVIAIVMQQKLKMTYIIFQ